MKSLYFTLLFLLPSLANSALLEYDYQTQGDNNITYDTNTGLQWLDIDVTEGLTPNESLDAAVGSGWRFATLGDLSDLLQVNGSFDPLTESTRITLDSSRESYDSLFDIFGVMGFQDIDPVDEVIAGYFLDESGAYDVFYAHMEDDCGGIYTHSCYYNLYAIEDASVMGSVGYLDHVTNEPSMNVGAFLVRGVDEPSSAILFLSFLGLLGLSRISIQARTL